MLEGQAPRVRHRTGTAGFRKSMHLSLKTQVLVVWDACLTAQPYAESLKSEPTDFTRYFFALEAKKNTQNFNSKEFCKKEGAHLYHHGWVSFFQQPNQPFFCLPSLQFGSFAPSFLLSLLVKPGFSLGNKNKPWEVRPHGSETTQRTKSDAQQNGTIPWSGLLYYCLAKDCILNMNFF